MPRRCSRRSNKGAAESSVVAPKVLFIQNDHVATPALLGEAFAERGFHVETFEVVPFERTDDPAVEVAFPDPAGYDVVASLGARWPVYEHALIRSWVGPEMQMMRDADAAGVAVLGICFGGQLLAQAYGGSVMRSSAPEIGWHQIDSDDTDLVPAGRWFQWHFDRWTLPPGATEIARNHQASQAFVLGRSLALQFHPELDRALLERWLADDRDGEAAKLGIEADELRTRTAEYQDETARRIRDLVTGFVDRFARRAAAREG
jgi:GMP synthase-like glutamine amidotransferase